MVLFCYIGKSAAYQLWS